MVSLEGHSMLDALCEQYTEFRKRYGLMGLVRLGLAPVTCVVTTPMRYVQLCQVCWAAGSRLWSSSQDFDGHKGLLGYAYHTQALALSRHGPSGRCPYLGSGRYPLSAWWHLTWPSLYLYWKSTALVPLVSIFVWWLTSWIWLGHSQTALLVLALLAASSSLYGQALLRQNYNALGWMFWPVALWATILGYTQVATGLWLGASFFSFTAVFAAGLVCGIFSVLSQDPWPLLGVVPGLLKLACHLLPNLWQGNLLERVTVTAKAIGFHKSKNSAAGQLLYPQVLGTRTCYMLGLFFVFFVASFANQHWSLYLAAYLVYLLNLKKRFADDQSVELMLLSTASALVFCQFSWTQFCALWLIACPIPLLDLRSRGWSVFDTVPELELLDFRILETRLHDFLKPVPDRSRVLMAFSDPQEDFFQAFEGQRVTKESLCYCAAQREIHISPDWWFVFDQNFEGGERLWGLSSWEVLENARKISAQFVVLPSQGDVPPRFSEDGFELLGCYTWAENCPFNYSQEFLHWWLLRCPPHSQLAVQA
jgi:hypothetical protein